MINTIKGAYITFNTIEQLETILNAFDHFGYKYKNRFTKDVVEVCERNSKINKINFKDNYIVTSKDKTNIISYKTFNDIVNAELGKTECDNNIEEISILNINNKQPMKTTAQ
jgi:hypothetical protein